MIRRNKKKGQSLARSIKRGHVTAKMSNDKTFIEFYRRTRTSKVHDVFIGHINIA